MRVFINKQQHNFHSDYNPMRPSDNGWEKQNQDAFKICQIGNNNVFVKRFDKPADKISGHHFLRKVQNKKMPFLPMIYDLVSATENNRQVTYLFQEVLDGKTFEGYVSESKKLTINPHRLMRNLHSAFKYISEQGFWYTDFVPKNIFVGQDGNFYLIDLDSVVSLDILANADCHELSNVDRRYTIAISKYGYKNILNYDYAMIRDNLKGDTVNFLALFIFLGQCHYFVDSGCKVNFLEPNTLKYVPTYLMQKNPIYTEAIFKSCFSYDKASAHQQPLNINLLNNYLQKILFSDTQSIVMDFSEVK